MTDRRPIGYVVEIDGPFLLINLLRRREGMLPATETGFRQ